MDRRSHLPKSIRTHNFASTERAKEVFRKAGVASFMAPSTTGHDPATGDWMVFKTISDARFVVMRREFIFERDDAVIVRIHLDLADPQAE